MENNKRTATMNLVKSAISSSGQKSLLRRSGFTNQIPYVVAIVSFGKEKRTLQLVDYEEDQLRVGRTSGDCCQKDWQCRQRGGNFLWSEGKTGMKNKKIS